MQILTWRGTSVGGRVIIGTICDEIRSRELFVADVTGLNPNVLFELGFAVALRKRIWLLLDPNIERAKLDFERFQLLTTIGYWPYSNSLDIINGFYSDAPYKKLDQDLYRELLQSTTAPAKKDAVLYLKSDVDTEATIAIARRVANGKLSSVIDDPKEVRVQPFSWYVQQATAAFAVVCHLLSTEYKNWELHNAKHALIAGLAHGLARPLLMLAHEPYTSPIDYRDLLRTHSTAAKAEGILDAWLTRSWKYANNGQWSKSTISKRRKLRESCEVSRLEIRSRSLNRISSQSISFRQPPITRRFDPSIRSLSAEKEQGRRQVFTNSRRSFPRTPETTSVL